MFTCFYFAIIESVQLKKIFIKIRAYQKSVHLKEIFIKIRASQKSVHLKEMFIKIRASQKNVYLVTIYQKTCISNFFGPYSKTCIVKVRAA
jgi:hypothetical protein